MKFSVLKESILAQFAAPRGNRVVPFITGKPGGGKSACAREIAAELVRLHKIPAERVVEFNPSLREPTDILGLPRMDGECARWLPPEEFYALRKGVGPCVLIVEELSDATMDMQNPLCRVLLDRFAGNMPLSDDLFIIATGNRTEDRSGASRLSTKLANRCRILGYEEDLDDWVAWARTHDVPPELVAFIRFRPMLLSDFDANRSKNPTPRSWEDVARVPMGLSPDAYFEHCAGSVGEGAATEWVGFLRMFQELPDFDAILRTPERAPVPTKPDVLYATSAKIVSVTTKTNIDKLWKFVKRMPADFVVLTARDWLARYPFAGSGKWFMEFASTYSGLMV